MQDINFIAIHGSNKHTPQLARKANWHYGSRSDGKLYSDDVFMLDFNWQDTDPNAWQNFVEMCKQFQPTQATVMDVLTADDIPKMYERLHDITSLGITPVIVPKFKNCTYSIPYCFNYKNVIIGVSVPTNYAGYLPFRDELIGRKLHLLGGHPDQWAYLMSYYKYSSVTSIDTNNQFRCARSWGKMWSRYGGYKELRGEGYSTNALIVCGMRNMTRYIASKRAPRPNAKRVKDCKKVLGLI